MVLLLLPKLYSKWLHVRKRYHLWRTSYSAFLVELDRSHPIMLQPLGDNLASRALRHFHVLLLRLQLVVHDFRFVVHASIYRLVTLASLRETFYPLFLHMLYIAVGPYFIGELVPISSTTSVSSGHSRYGFFYAYGMYISGNWIPLLDTWAFALLELLYIVLPLTLYLSFCITPAGQLYAERSDEEFAHDLSSSKVFYFPPLHNRRHYPIHRMTYVRFLVVGVVFYQLVNLFFVG